MTSVPRQHIRAFIGIDLGGSRGKSTAVAALGRTESAVAVESVHSRAPGGGPWVDDALFALADSLDPASSVVAVAAPLTVPACLRCVRPACPGVSACDDPAIVWLRTEGEALQAAALAGDRDRIAAVPRGEPRPMSALPPSRTPIAPYTHRCTEVALHYRRDLMPRDRLGQGPGAIASRGAHLRRQFQARGFSLNRNLLEVSPRATIHALFGARLARHYKRDADPWKTRASILEAIGAELSFSPGSRLSREEVLQNDHCFDALLGAYTAYLWARDDWQAASSAPLDEDGWIWAPPARRP